MSEKLKKERGRILSNLTMKFDNRAGGLIRKKESVMFFRIFKKKRIQAQIDELENVIKTIEEMDQKEAQ